MAISIASITRGRAAKAPRIILLGVEKIGKSQFSAAAPGAIFMPMKGERGLDAIDAAKFPPAQSYAQVTEMIGELYNEKHDFQTAVIDSSSALEPLIWDHVCQKNGADTIEKVGGGYGKGATESLGFWRELTDGLDAIRDERNMASIIIGHVATKEFNDPETDPYTTYTWDINHKAASLLGRWADFILFANYRRAVVAKTDAGFGKTKSRGVGGGERILYAGKTPSHPGGGRYTLPAELPLTWDAFSTALAKAMEVAPSSGGGCPF